MLILGEFSEIEGPVSVLVAGASSLISPQSILAEVISMDYHNDGGHDFKICANVDVSISPLSCDAKLHALATLFALHDVESRGFCRRFALCFVTADSEKLTFSSDIYLGFRQIVQLLQVGNMLVFMRDAICELADYRDLFLTVFQYSLKHFTEQIYPEFQQIASILLPDNLPLSNAVRSELEQIRKFDVSRLDDSEYCSTFVFDTFGHHTRSIAFKRSSQEFLDQPRRLLKDIVSSFELYSLIERIFNETCAYYLQSRSILHRLGGTTPLATGTARLYMGQYRLSPPKLLNKEPGGLVRVFQECDDLLLVNDHSFPGHRISKSLLRFVGRYGFSKNVIYSLLTGRPVVILANSSREASVKMLVQTLSIFVPSSSKQASLVNVVYWTRQYSPVSKLCGLSKSSEMSLDALPKSASVFDYEGETFTGPPYESGRLLNTLIQKSKLFNDDGTFLAFVHIFLEEVEFKASLYSSIVSNRCFSFSESLPDLLPNATGDQSYGESVARSHSTVPRTESWMKLLTSVNRNSSLSSSATIQPAVINRTQGTTTTATTSGRNQIMELFTPIETSPAKPTSPKQAEKEKEDEEEETLGDVYMRRRSRNKSTSEHSKTSLSLTDIPLARIDDNFLEEDEHTDESSRRFTSPSAASLANSTAKGEFTAPPQTDFTRRRSTNTRSRTSDQSSLQAHETTLSNYSKKFWNIFGKAPVPSTAAKSAVSEISSNGMEEKQDEWPTEWLEYKTNVWSAVLDIEDPQDWEIIAYFSTCIERLDG